VLVGFPDGDWWVDRAFERVDRRPTAAERARILSCFDRIRFLPGFEEDERIVDTSVEANRRIVVRRLVDVGIDADIAQAIWELDCTPAAWPVFPDAAEVVGTIRARGYRTALVSDFHADVREHLRTHGIELDAYVLSFEHAIQKPDPAMFLTAVHQLGVAAGETLMVGDRAGRDGGAAAVGIDTFILAPARGLGPRGLDVVLGLLP
jgi:putative hydrolase of the HAD superfamily